MKDIDRIKYDDTKDICSPNGCYSCHLQDTNYCPYEADFPHFRVFLISVAISLIIVSPLIFLAWWSA